MAKPDFSIVITTRNRPEMFEVALKSVLVQKGVSLEVVVVNDGSSKNHLAKYTALESKYADNVQFLYLVSSMSGHGQSYAVNHGVLNATGKYIAFLDDDDHWIDEGHLSRCLGAFKAENDHFQVYCSLQEAWFNGELIKRPIWLEKNHTALTQYPAKSERIFYGELEDVVANGVFAQVNTVIISRDHFIAIGGFDENLRYECDREFFLRAVDESTPILFADVHVSKHYVPDPEKSDNMSTALQGLSKFQYQLTLYTKLILSAKSAPVLRQAHLGHGYTLKHMAVQLVGLKQYKNARRYAGMALLSHFSFKWMGYYLFTLFRGIFSSK